MIDSLIKYYQFTFSFLCCRKAPQTAAKLVAKQALNHEEDLADFLDDFDDDLCKVSANHLELKILYFQFAAAP